MTSFFDKPRPFWIHLRMVLIAIGLSGMLVAVLVRVYLLQTLHGEDLRQKAERQSTRTIKMKAKRGTIYDRNITEMAVSVEAPSIAVRPTQVEDPAALADNLAPILGISKSSLQKTLSSKRGFAWLTRQTTPEVESAVLQLQARGIEVHVENKRFYPMGTVAGQLLGFTNIDGVGLEGIERAYDSQLAGKEFEIEGFRDARGRTLFTQSLPELAKYEGGSIVLTIDHRLQQMAENEITQAVKEFQASGAYAIILDVKTGEILAMANTPGFNPNQFLEHVAREWRLRSVTDTFEPGSVTKPLVLAAALQEKTIKLHSKIDTEQGRIQIGKYTIRDSHRSGLLTAAEVIQKSSNIGIYKVAQSIGKAKLYQYLHSFGFGTRTGVGLRGEQPGIVWPYDSWAEVSFANIAFGQGFTATPLQILTGVAAIANQGILMKPQIVKTILNQDGSVARDFSPIMVRHVVSKEVARQTAWALSLVTRQGGTGTRSAMDGISVAAKTGTSQKVNPKTKRYDPDLWTGSIVGFVPAERPEVALFVMLDEPKVSHYGGVVAGPIFKRLATEALRLRATPPVPDDEKFRFYDNQELQEKSNVQNLQKEELQEEWVLPEVVLPPMQLDLPQDTMPDLFGLTLKEAINNLRDLGFLPRVSGWGRVISQEPPPGTSLDDIDQIEIRLAPQLTHDSSP